MGSERHRSRKVVTIVVFVLVSGLSGLFGFSYGRTALTNSLCCQIPAGRNRVLSLEETLHLVHFYSQIGQDRWVTEVAFPGVRNGFFLDVGSADGVKDSNTKALEERGWSGVCVDPFPSNMEGRTCQMFKEVVSSQSGQHVEFRAAGVIGGIDETLGKYKDQASRGHLVDFTTVTLADILDRAKAPSFIHYVSLDIEGAELDALEGFPFDRYTMGALDVEHNEEEPKRTLIKQLMESHGYHRVHSWLQDDFYQR